MKYHNNMRKKNNRVFTIVDKSIQKESRGHSPDSNDPYGMGL